MPLSNPSFAKKMPEGNALGLLTRSGPRVLIFWRSRFMCMTYRGLPSLKVWGQIIWSLGGAQGQKSLADICLFRTIDSRVTDPASGRGAAMATSTLKPYLPRGNES
jgi:hypothetical protein